MEKRQSFGVLMLGGLVALGSIGVALFTTQFQEPNQDNSVVVSTEKNSGLTFESRQTDSDGDGLPDWKESLWGTDPNNTDSDGDGVFDGDEVAIGADPLKVGSDPISNSYTPPKSLPTTEAVARQLFVGYAKGRNDGTLSTQDTNNAINEALAVRSTAVSPADVFSLGDLNLKKNVGADTYETAVIKTLQESVSVREYELTVFARALNTTDAASFEKLESTALVYRSIRDKLIQMEVPESAATQHLALVNSLSELTESVHGLAGWGGDPLDALVLVDRFVAAENTIQETVDALLTFTSLLNKQS